MILTDGKKTICKYCGNVFYTKNTNRIYCNRSWKEKKYRYKKTIPVTTSISFKEYLKLNKKEYLWKTYY